MKSLIAPFETKRFGALSSYPRGAPEAPTEEAPPATDSAAEEPTGEESEAAADTATEWALSCHKPPAGFIF